MSNDESDKKTGEEYARYRLEWLETLDGNHRNSVSSQLDHMVMDAVWFEWVLSLRRMATASIGPLNQHLWQMFLSGYVVRQLMGVRRLVSYQKDWKQGSLKEVVVDMQKRQHVFYRKIVTDQALNPSWPARRNRVGARFWLKSEDAAEQNSSDQLHGDADTRFDRLINLAPRKKRTSRQKVPTRVFEKLTAILSSNEIQLALQLSDKYLAHADMGVLEGRGNPLDYLGIHRCIEVFLQVRKFICWDILGHDPSGIGGEYKEDHLTNLDQPFVPMMKPQEYRAAWFKVDADIKKWAQGGLIREFVFSDRSDFITKAFDSGQK